MAKIRQKKLVVDPQPAADAWDWYQRTSAPEIDAWLAEIDAGNETPFATTTVPEAQIPEIEGTFDFAVVQKDAAGNESDPASFPGWAAGPFDLSPPPPATGGRIIAVVAT
jgi:hypothetical protein